MENQPSSSSAVKNIGKMDSSSTSKPPWQLKVSVGFMGFSAIKDIIVGVIFLFIFGFGLKSWDLQNALVIVVLTLPLFLGVICIITTMFTIKYAKAVLRMQRSGYTGSFALILWGLSTTGFGLIRSEKVSVMVTGLLFSFIYICSALILYYYREKFVS